MLDNGDCFIISLFLCQYCTRVHRVTSIWVTYSVSCAPCSVLGDDDKDFLSSFLLFVCLLFTCSPPRRRVGQDAFENLPTDKHMMKEKRHNKKRNVRMLCWWWWLLIDDEEVLSFSHFWPLIGGPWVPVLFIGDDCITYQQQADIILSYYILLLLIHC